MHTTSQTLAIINRPVTNTGAHLYRVCATIAGVHHGEDIVAADTDDHARMRFMATVPSIPAGSHIDIDVMRIA